MLVNFDSVACLQLLALVIGLPLLLIGYLLYSHHRSRREREAAESWRSIKAPAAPTAEKSSADRRSPDATNPLAGAPRVIKPAHDYLRVAIVVVFSAAIFGMVPTIPAVSLLVVLVIAFFARKIMREDQMARHGETAVGMIIDLDVDEGVSNLDSGRWLPPMSFLSESTRARFTYRFSVPDRPDVEFEGTFKVGGSRNLAMAVGKKAKVRYLPTDPRVSALELGDGNASTRTWFRLVLGGDKRSSDDTGRIGFSLRNPRA